MRGKMRGKNCGIGGLGLFLQIPENIRSAITTEITTKKSAGP